MQYCLLPITPYWGWGLLPIAYCLVFVCAFLIDFAAQSPQVPLQAAPHSPGPLWAPPLPLWAPVRTAPPPG